METNTTTVKLVGINMVEGKLRNSKLSKSLRCSYIRNLLDFVLFVPVF